MNQQVITAFFDNRADATKAIDELVKAGIPRASLKLMPETETTSTPATTRSSYDPNRDEKGFWASLGDLFLPEDDRYTYAEAMNRGDIMVSATVDAAHVEKAEDILEKYGTVNIEEREQSWRKEGWKGYSAEAGGAGARPGVAAVQTGATAKTSTGTGDETISIVEEQLKIGKRQVTGGRVKVRSYVVETPVSEQVSLRTENVHVERRPVDRAAVVDADFRERTIEAQATSEEAVVSKDARVKEELVIKKDVEQRTETVSDSVRSTKVDIDDERTAASKRDDKMARQR